MRTAAIYPLVRLPCDKGTFSYAAPEELTIAPGQLVRVPFRKKNVFGVVVSIDHSESASSPLPLKLQNIHEVIHPMRFFTQEELAYAQTLARFYHIYPGLFFKKMAPPLQPRVLTKIAFSFPEHSKEEPAEKRTLVWFDNPSDHAPVIAFMDRLRNRPSIHIVPTEQHLQMLYEKLTLKFPEQSILRAGSDSTPRRMNEIWFAARTSAPAWIITTRSGCFLPANADNSLFLWHPLDQNHKNWDALPYTHSSDVLHLRRQYQSFAYYEVSHSASIEQIVALQRKEAQEITPWKPQFCPYTSVDMHDEYRKKNFSGVSDEIQKFLSAAQPSAQCLILHNRKGYAEQAQCKECDTLLPPLQRTCTRCKGTRIRYSAKGIEAVQDDIQKQFPGKKIMLCSADTDAAMQFDDASIIIATDVAFSRIHFQNIAAVWIPYADRFLTRPWYSSVEDGIYFFRELCARVRPETPIIAHTWQHEHLFWRALKDVAALRKLYALEQKSREQHGYPPYSYLVRLLLPEQQDTLPKYDQRGTTYRTKMEKIDAMNWIEETIALARTLPADARIDPRPLPF